MLSAIYKSRRHAGMYLYIAKRGDFSAVPPALLQRFGQEELLMLFNLNGEKPLALADKQTVSRQIQKQGFYLQMPRQEENLLEQFKLQNRKADV
ncbi:YcgL domain-containing protein [Testudinibacter sp. P80/BLE/0925]|uniref:YcgL domain-containing protein n=1 Tax=Testudinibacter sp. TW-1 TaxID=3417757 RepID=UPI003D35AED0